MRAMAITLIELVAQTGVKVIAQRLPQDEA